ncbi:Rid family detoxifying hydrolase [Salinigranum halophilum]|jgi:reactive intermediate/imine deaminase|uniref:Rid family detoxifying hydrolase n=1 Tax=Salinigranum halophilum TaxID=2565931 RepID=UPI00115D0396|nr:Rid family detoxifying hydrolase [Salinigranum halophilum]
MRERHTENAPQSIGSFSQAIEDGNRIYVSGQGPIDPASGERIEGDVAAQTALTLANVDAILQAAGCSLDDAVKTTVFVRDMDDYDALNELYGKYLSEPYPARSAVEIVRLPVDIDVEVEAIATAANR